MAKQLNRLPKEGRKLLVEEYLSVYCLIEKGFTEKTIRNKKEALNRLQTFLSNSELMLKSSLDYMKHLHEKSWRPNFAFI